MVKKLVDDYREEILNGPDVNGDIEIEKVQFNRVYTKPSNDTEGPNVVIVEVFLDSDKGADTVPNHIGLKTEVSNKKHPTEIPLIGFNIVGRPHDWRLDLVTTVAMTTQVETTQPETTPEITTVEVTTEEETTEEPIPPTPEPVPTTTMVTTVTMTTTPEVTTEPLTTTPEVTTQPETTPEPTTTPVVTTTTTPEPTTPEITTVEVTTA